MISDIDILIREIYENVNSIYKSFYNVFSLDEEEFKQMMLNLLTEIKEKNFYQNIEVVKDILSENNLIFIKEFLKRCGLEDEIIKKVIIKSPYIVLYSTKLNKIYPIFKNKYFKGYSILDMGKYITYIYNENVDKINSNNYIVDRMIESLSRDDIKKSALNLDQEKINILDNDKKIINTLNDDDIKISKEFNLLTKEYSMKNYYFKKIK